MKYYFKSKSKKYLLATILLLSLCPLLGLTYSSFIFSSDNYRASEMYIGSLMYGIKINDESVSKITVAPGETEVNIEITSLNIVSSFYKLIYKENSNILVEYNEDNDLPSGDISNKKEITIKITNSSSSNIEVEFDIASGYITNTIEQVIIPQGYTEVTGIYIVNDINVVALYVDGEKVDSLDTNANYELDSYTCTNNETVSWDNDTKAITIKPITEITGCTLYFSRIKPWYETCTASSNNLNCKIITAQTPNSDENIDFAQISSDTNGNGLYYTSNLDLTEDYDGDGTGDRVYYYRGAVENNNVVFGEFANDEEYYKGYESSTSTEYGSISYPTLESCQSSSYNYNCEKVTVAKKGKKMCWRIVRTNEDGSVRLRYNGEYSNGTCPVTGTEVKINNTIYQFYKEYGDQKYNEYIWEDGTGESLAKTTIDAWYTSSGLEDYEDQIANVPYCADKSNPTHPLSGDLTNYTVFGAANRILDYSTSGFGLPIKNDAQPSYKCIDVEDKHTVSGDTWGGNGKLQYPIALLTADEALFASILESNLKTNFLYANSSYWTMSPSDMSGRNYSNLFYITLYPVVNIDLGPDCSRGLLPVISLKPEVTVTLSGTGSYTNPYVVE